MTINFTHHNGQQILNTVIKNGQYLKNAMRSAETASLCQTLQQIAGGLQTFAQILRFYTQGTDAKYRTAENYFTQAMNNARSGHERHTLEALAEGLISLSNAVGSTPKASGFSSTARQHFNTGLRLARSGRQRSVIKEFALGLQALAKALALVINTLDNQWVRELLQPQERFAKSASYADRGRQGPALYQLASGLNVLGDVTTAGMDYMAA